MWWLCQATRQLGLTGVRLKGRSEGLTLTAEAEAVSPAPAQARAEK